MLLKRLGFDRDTFYLRMFGLTSVPMIYFARPYVIEANEKRCEIVVPLRRQTRNHLKSMYFGALSTGADIAAGFLAMKLARIRKIPVVPVFKSFKADFLKRAEGDVHFVCEDVSGVLAQFEKCVKSGERVTFPVQIIAYVPSKLGREPVAKFELGLSIKPKNSQSSGAIDGKVS